MRHVLRPFPGDLVLGIESGQFFEERVGLAEDRRGKGQRALVGLTEL